MKERDIPRISKRKRKIKQELHNILVYILVLIFFLPVIWIVLTSMRPEIEVNARPPVWLPRSLTFDSFSALFGTGHTEKSVPFYDYLRNSLYASLLIQREIPAFTGGGIYVLFWLFSCRAL